MNLTIGILPAAGSASRMNGIPKFLLPTGQSGKSLVERHIEQMSHFTDQIWIPTRPKYVNLITSLNLGSNVIVAGINSKTMSETVLHVTNFSRDGRYLLGLPDSYFDKVNPYEVLANSEFNLMLAGFKIRPDQRGKLGQFKLEGELVVDAVDKSPNCDYGQAWGAISFSQEFVNLIHAEESHVGIAFPRALSLYKVGARVLDTNYFDCGTPSEYFKMLLETSAIND